MVKECILAAMGEIFDYYKDKNKLITEIRQIQLSKQTIVRMISVSWLYTDKAWALLQRPRVVEIVQHPPRFADAGNRTPVKKRQIYN